jgi:hypothetical protein
MGEVVVAVVAEFVEALVHFIFTGSACPIFLKLN